MPEENCHPAALAPDILLRECEAQFLRRSGPGGQHRNKVSTAVVLLHRPTGIKAEANERRSQSENRAEALRRLRVNLALEVRTTRDAPSALWKSRCRAGRIDVSTLHEDFPAILAEALDAIASARFDPKVAVEELGCSVSQVIKLLKQEPRALAQVNTARQREGLHALQ